MPTRHRHGRAIGLASVRAPEVISLGEHWGTARDMPVA
jgi:hypothetical protein